MNEIELRAILAGDPDATRAFVREYGPILLAVVRRKLIGSNRAQEDDVLQDLFLGLLRDDGRVLRLWDVNKGRSFKAFVQVFAERRTLDWLRHQQRERREELTDETSLTLRQEGSQRTEVNEIPEWLDLVMARFQREASVEDRELFQLLYIDELTIAETSRKLGITPEAVYQRRHRLKKRLAAWKAELSESGRVGAYTSVRVRTDTEEDA